jgi:hypothetical protein
MLSLIKLTWEIIVPMHLEEVSDVEIIKMLSLPCMVLVKC